MRDDASWEASSATSVLKQFEEQVEIGPTQNVQQHHLAITTG